MPCYHPITTYNVGPRENGKARLSFTYQKNSPVIILPCGQCIGCRLERSRQWALRCMHEASLYDQNCFITLTYATEHLPKNNSLEKSDFQKFMKRFRKAVNPEKIRYYMCGEYGDLNHRPHFHACIFNYDFADKELWKTHKGEKYYVSPRLEKLWPFGHCVIGDVTFESAAYVARYVTKKVTGKKSRGHYERINEETGEVITLTPEYNDMSRRPGIGRIWYDRYKSDLKKDFITARGVKMKPPKYYDSILERESEEEYKKLKEKRAEQAELRAEPEGLGNRLEVKEKIKMKQFKQLKRTHDEN